MTTDSLSSSELQTSSTTPPLAKEPLSKPNNDPTTTIKWQLNTCKEEEGTRTPNFLLTFTELVTLSPVALFDNFHDQSTMLKLRRRLEDLPLQLHLTCKGWLSSSLQQPSLSIRLSLLSFLLPLLYSLSLSLSLSRCYPQKVWCCLLLWSHETKTCMQHRCQHNTCM